MAKKTELGRLLDGMKAPIDSLQLEVKKIEKIQNDPHDWRVVNPFKTALEEIKGQYLKAIKILMMEEKK